MLAAVQGLVIFAGVRRMADSRGGHGSRGVGDDDVVVADFSLEEMELDASRRFKTRRFVVPGDHWDLLSNSSQVWRRRLPPATVTSKYKQFFF